MFDTNGNYADLASLQGSDNRYLFYRRERPLSGQSWTKVNFFVRPDVGVTYPRFRIRK